MSEGRFCVPSTVKGLAQEANANPNPNLNSNPVKKKRSLPGTPDPDAEVISLSPKSLMATNRFMCEICNKGFQRDQNLQLHRRGHNLPWKLRQRTNKEVRKKVYVCPEKTCVHHDPSRALGDLTGIKKHYSRKHGEKRWKCEKCSKKYAVQSDWKAHSKICGTREYKCDCGTIFSRKDSFITHRAFCDALAGENTRFGSASASNPILKHGLANGTISNPPLAGIPQFSSSFPPEFTGSESAGNLVIVDGQKPKLPLWLDYSNPQFNPLRIANNSNAYLTNLSELPPAASMNMFGSTSQAQWLNKYPETSSASATLFIPPLPRGLKEEEESNGNFSQNVENFYAPIQNHQQGPAHLSATALLQKAAQVGSTRSSPVLDGTSFRSMSSSHSNVSNSGNEVEKFYRQQSQAVNLNELMRSLSSPIPTTTTRGQPPLSSSNPSSFLSYPNHLEHLLVPTNAKQEQDVSGRLHASLNKVEQGLTRDFLGVGGDGSRPLLQEELAKFASMGAARDFSQYSEHHS